MISAPAAHRRFGTRVGLRDNEKGTLTSNGRHGFVQFGPYIKFNPRDCVVKWLGVVEEAAGKEHRFVDAVFNKGNSLVKREPLALKVHHDETKDIIAQIDFILGNSVEDLEYRFYVNDSVRVTLETIVFRETGRNPEKE